MIRPMKLLVMLALMLLLSAARNASADEAKGTIKSVDTEKHQIVLKGLFKDATYHIDKNAAICLDGEKSMLADLKEGDRVTLTYAQQGEQMMANDVRGLRNAQEATGTVRTAFPERNEIVLKGILRDTTYDLTKTAMVWINGKQGTLADVHEGDQALVTYQQKGEHFIASNVRLTRK